MGRTTQAIEIVGVAVAIAALAGAFLVPEVRRIVGLDPTVPQENQPSGERTREGDPRNQPRDRDAPRTPPETLPLVDPGLSTPPNPLTSSAPSNRVSRIEPQQEFSISGRWLVSDVQAPGSPLTSISLLPDGGYQGGSWGRELGGPNGLGANQYRFEIDTLSFLYVQPGRARIDEMLVGSVQIISPTEFMFTVVDGVNGRSSRGLKLRFTR